MKKNLILSLICVLVFTPALRAAEEKTYAQEALEKRQRVELLSFFMKEPGQAKLPQTSMAIELYNQGVEFYEKKDYEPALIAFESSLKYDGSNALAYELMADIYYFQQKMELAAENYRKAFEIAPRKGLKEKLEKIQTETQVESGMSTYHEEHFIIKYKGEGEGARYEGFDLREMLRENYRQISKDFAYYFNHKVVVLLYDQAEFEQLTKLPHWAAGVYDGKVRMPAYKSNFSDQELRALTAHELTHAFVSAMSQGRAPVWINEGLAEYEEAKVTENKLMIFKAAVKTDSLLTLDELTYQNGLLEVKDTLKVALFYEQAYQFTSYLIDRYGMFKIKQLLEAFGEGKNTDAAIRDVLKISMRQLEQAWRETL